MRSILTKDLQAVVDRINYITGNAPLPYKPIKDGKFKANIGCYHLDWAYGGVALHQIMSKGGGVNDIFGGHYTKRELYNRMHAWLTGYFTADFAKNTKSIK